MSDDSQTPAHPAAVILRFGALIRRALEGVDLPSLQLASKTGLAIVLAVGISFWLNLSATIAAVTALMIQLGYVGATMQRGLLRLAGGACGAIFGMVLLALFGQDRGLFIGAMALGVGTLVYFLQGTRNWYAYILAVASMVLVGYGQIEHPQHSFQFSIFWVSGIMLAVVIMSLVHGVLWPTTTSGVFERQLRECVGNCRELMRLLSAAVEEGQNRRADVAGVEGKIIQGLPKLRETLQTAALDSWRIEKYEASYSRLLDVLAKLARRVIEVSANLNICQAETSLRDVVRKSSTLRETTHRLECQLRSLIDAFAEPRDGEKLPDLDHQRRQFDQLFAQLSEEFDAVDAAVFEKGALIGLHAKLRQLGSDVADIRTALANVETKSSVTAARAAGTARSPDVPSGKARLMKAAAASLVMVAVPCVWIWTNWPMALNRLMLYSAVMGCFNSFLPSIPRRAILRAIGVGAVGGGLLYFGVLRPLDGYAELGAALFCAAVPYCYLMNSPRPTVMLTGIFGGMIMLGLIDLSLVQQYSFSRFVNNLIGYSGGFFVGMTVLQVFARATPEQTFCETVRAFFRTCEQTLGAPDAADPPWTDRGGEFLRKQSGTLLKTLGMCGLWSKIIDPRRVSGTNSRNVRGVLAAMQLLLYRIEMTEQARLLIPNTAQFAAFRAAERDLRTTFGGALRSIQDAIAGGTQNEMPDLRAKVREYRQQLEALRGNPVLETLGREQISHVLVLAGYYRALADAIEQCHQSVEGQDWQKLQQSYL